MRTLLCLAILGLLLFTPSLTAQTITYIGVPDNDPTSGGANVIPFGSGTSASWINQRYQSLVMASFLPGRPGLLRSVGFAPSGTGTITFDALILMVGHNTTGSLGPTFDASYSGPKSTVINQANYSWPVTANTWNRFPIERPVIYNGTDNLVVEVIALGSNNPTGGFRRMTEPRFYTTGSNTSFTGSVATYGTGCQGSNARIPFFANSSFPMLGVDEFQLGVADGLANTTAILLIGESSMRFGALPLPFSLAGIGALGCNLNTSIILTAGTILDASGEGRARLSLPNNPAIEGLSIFSQWLLLDGPANPAGLVTTEGRQNTVGSVAPSTPTGGAAALKVEIGIL